MANIHADRAVFVVNNSAWRPNGEAVFDWKRLLKTVASFGFSDSKVYPLGPAIRAESAVHLIEFSHLISLEDWVPTCDSSHIVFNPRHMMMAPYVVGRHGRDGPEKWHESKKALEGAFPKSSAFKIYILGGAEKAQTTLGHLPDNWVVYPYGAMAVADFLQRLDVFVYFPHSDLNEAFGRTILEAMFAGVPCVLPHRFAETFGNKAFYCDPEDVRGVVDRLAEGDRQRLEFVTEVHRQMVAQHDSLSLLDRVPEFELPGPHGTSTGNFSESLLEFKHWVETGKHT